MKLLISIIILLSASAVTAIADEKWQASELVGYMLELDSKTAVQQFSFTERGDVLATLGAKDGLICGPLLSWKIDSSGVLRIAQEDGKMVIILKKLKVSGNRYYVDEDGMKREYFRKDWPEYQAAHPKKMNRANQALVPTPMSVTPAADAPVAPATGAAHL